MLQHGKVDVAFFQVFVQVTLLWCSLYKCKQRWAPFAWIFSIFPRFSGILPGLSTNQNFCGCACTPAFYTIYMVHCLVSVKF